MWEKKGWGLKALGNVIEGQIPIEYVGEGKCTKFCYDT